jgi:8-oxo-dGTP diphosphatase
MHDDHGQAIIRRVLHYMGSAPVSRGEEALTEPEAAVAIVCAQKPKESVLLIRRSQREEDSWSGHWSFPGGRREPQDPDLLHTALRELEEECGIRLRREHMEAALSPVLARRRAGPFVLVAPFVFRAERELPTLLDPQEAVEALWIAREVLCDPARHGLHVIPGRPGELQFPGIELNSMPLWGFTYRLITDWLALLPKPPDLEAAGFETARRILQFLLSHGLKLEHDWEDQIVKLEGAEQQVKRTCVRGIIPVELVRAHFALPGSDFPRMNVLEVRPHQVRVTGLAYEEYLIAAVSDDSAQPAGRERGEGAEQ